MEKENIDSKMEQIYALMEEDRFGDAIWLAEDLSLKRKLPEIYEKLETKGAMAPAQAGRDMESLGLLKESIKYFKLHEDYSFTSNQKINQLKNWIFKDKKEMQEDSLELSESNLNQYGKRDLNACEKYPFKKPNKIEANPQEFLTGKSFVNKLESEVIGLN